jgi:hypothetical protein
LTIFRPRMPEEFGSCAKTRQIPFVVAVTTSFREPVQIIL